MPAATLTITPDTQTDPNATPPANVQDTSSQGVTRVEVDPNAAPPAKTDEQPAKKFAGKYETPEELERAYKELETRLGQPPKPATALTPESAQQVATDAGLDLTQLTQEYAEKGELSQDAYTKLAAKGIDKATVDAYVAGQKAIGEQYATKLAESVGGTDALNTIITWAGANLTPAEIAAFNKATASMDEATAGLALAGLQAKYVAANGQDPSLVGGAPVTTSGVKPYASNDELVKAMSNPKYKTDSAYRDSVYQRLAVTNQSNWIHN